MEINDINAQIQDIADTLKRCILILSLSTDKELKVCLIRILQIEPETAKIWKYGDYENNFFMCWNNYLNEKILSKDSVTLHKHFNLMKKWVELIYIHLENNGLSDLLKWCLYILVDSLDHIDIKRMNFYIQKLDDNQPLTRNSSFMFFIHQDLKGYYKRLNADLLICISHIRIDINPLPEDLSDRLYKIENLLNKLYKEFALKRDFTDKDVLKQSISDFYVLTELVDKSFLQELEKISNEEITLEVKIVLSLRNDLVKCLTYYQDYYEVEDFEIMDHSEDSKVNEINYIERIYFKYVPVNKIKKKNNYENIINDHLKNSDFRKLFQDICSSKVVQSFYQYEKSLYFPDEVKEPYCTYIMDPERLWKSIKVVPLPESYAAATTMMQIIYLNNIPKRFDNSTDYDEYLQVN
jgi:hypothetical protein